MKFQVEKLPWASLGVAGVQILIYGWEWRAAQLGLVNVFLNDFGFNWNRFLDQPLGEFPTLMSHIFIHGSLDHLLGNLLFFFLFAPAIERTYGRGWFLAGYLMAGGVAGIIHGYFNPMTLLLGSSGAMSGLAGAYLVLFPLKMPEAPLWGRFRFKIKIPAILSIGLWIGFNWFMGNRDLAGNLPFNGTIQVGYLAHLGGFLAGSLMTLPFLWPGRN